MTSGSAIALPRQPTAQTVTTRSTTKMRPMPDPEPDELEAVGREQGDQQQQQVGVEGDGAVADRDLLQPVAQRGAGQPVRSDVLQRAALPAHPLPPQRPPGRHHLGDDPALHRRDHLRAQRLQRQRHLVVLGQRQRVVDLAGIARQQLPARVGDRLQRVGAEQGRGAGQDEDLALPTGDVALVAGVLVALQLADQARSRPRRRRRRRPRSDPGRPRAAPSPSRGTRARSPSRRPSPSRRRGR